MGRVLIDELQRMGATFIDYHLVEDCEEEFFQSLGLEPIRGHLVYCIDRRPTFVRSSLVTCGGVGYADWHVKNDRLCEKP